MSPSPLPSREPRSGDAEVVAPDHSPCGERRRAQPPRTGPGARPQPAAARWPGRTGAPCRAGRAAPGPGRRRAGRRPLPARRAPAPGRARGPLTAAPAARARRRAAPNPRVRKTTVCTGPRHGRCSHPVTRETAAVSTPAVAICLTRVAVEDGPQRRRGRAVHQGGVQRLGAESHARQAVGDHVDPQDHAPGVSGSGMPRNGATRMTSTSARPPARP